MSTDTDRLLSRARQRCDSWHVSATRWHVSGWVISLLGVGSGLAIGAFTHALGDLGTRMLGFAAGMSTAAIGGLKPIEMGNRYRQAWRLLDDALLKFEAGVGGSVGTVTSAIAQGERIIGSVPGGSDVPPTPPRQP